MSKFHLFLRIKHGFDLFKAMNLALSHTRTEGLDLIIPGLWVHVLWPKGPCSTVLRAGYISRALILFKEHAIALIFWWVNEMNMTTLLSTILLQELGFGDAEIFSKSFLICVGEVNKTITPPGSAAFTRPLTFKLNSFSIKRLTWHVFIFLLKMKKGN
jgi:hypothetical protein